MNRKTSSVRNSLVNVDSSASRIVTRIKKAFGKTPHANSAKLGISIRSDTATKSRESIPVSRINSRSSKLHDPKWRVVEFEVYLREKMEQDRKREEDMRRCEEYRRTHSTPDGNGL